MSGAHLWSVLTLMLYFAFGIFDVLSLWIGGEWEVAHFVTKCLLMPCLILFIWIQRAQVRNHRLMLLALCLSFVGDVCLLNQGFLPMVSGIAAFLLAHICYITWFLGGMGISLKEVLRNQFPAIILIIVIESVILMTLWPGLGSMRIPVTIYALVITVMTLAAFSRKGHVSMLSFLLVSGGSAMFMLSDTLYATVNFGADIVTIPRGEMWIMLTYIIAQGLIALGSTQENLVGSARIHQSSDLLQ